MIVFTLGKGTPEEREVSYDDTSLMSSEVIALQKVTGQPVRELLELFRAGDMVAIMAFLWLAMRREALAAGSPVPSYSELDFDIYHFEMKRLAGAEEAVPVDPSSGPAKAAPTKKK